MASLLSSILCLPLIVTGIYGFPKADALQIAVSVFSEFLSDNEMDIILVVFDEDSFVLSGKIFSGIDAYIDENYVSEKLDQEYGLPAMASMAVPVAPSDNRRRDLGRMLGAAKAASAIPMPQVEDEEDVFLSEEADFSDMPSPCKLKMKEAELPRASKKAKRSLDDLVSNVGETWQESLFRLIDEKGYTDSEVYNRANVDRRLFSKIRSNADYQPKKITAVAFALALKLSLDETKDLLSRAGYALSPSSKFDLIIRYFIEQEVYDTYTINLALFDHKQPLLYE